MNKTRFRKRFLTVALLIVVTIPFLMFILAQRVLRSFEGLSLGDELPRAWLQNLNGEWEDARSWMGEPVLLLLFHADCAACKTEIGNFSLILRTNPSLGKLKLVLISLDSPQEARDFSGQFNPPFPIFTDQSGEFIRKARKMVVPTVYFFNRMGRVEYSRTGPMNRQTEETLLQTLLFGLSDRNLRN